MKYRVQVDLDFNEKADADAFEAYVATLGDKLYVPKLADITNGNGTELYTTNRMHIIKDYDDEGLMQPGEGVRTITLKQPITR